jgi:hypothetical protein
MDNLRKNIMEMEDLLNFLQRNQVPFTGYAFLITKIKELKIILAKLEADERELNHKLIKSN